MRTRMQKEARGERLHGALGQGGGALTGLEAQHPSAGWLKGSARAENLPVENSGNSGYFLFKIDARCCTKSGGGHGSPIYRLKVLKNTATQRLSIER